ncbi:MAG: tRNA (adenosine(37)-N6)-threonylcarbamoyltransferase complex dimerization subunit type 1 TsaB [Thermoguttaceae bacterium]
MMKLLALETTETKGSVALCEDGEIKDMRLLRDDQRSAQSLAPAIREILGDNYWLSTDVDVVAVATGPGSFTGLRVGVTTAKMLAWAWETKIVGVDSLDAIAETYALTERDLFRNAPRILSVGMDAQRGDAAVRDYLFLSDKSRAIPLHKRFRIVSIQTWLSASCDLPYEMPSGLSDKELSTGNFDAISEIWSNMTYSSVWFAGPALRRVKDVDEKYPNLQYIPCGEDVPNAAGVALSAWRRVRDDSFDDVWSILPIYSRRAAAEEKALEKRALVAGSKGVDTH